MSEFDVAAVLPPIRPEDLLAYADLYQPDERRGDSDPPVRETGVHCGRPLVYPVPRSELPVFLRERAEATGSRLYGVVFAFDLETTAGMRYTHARFEVRLTDQRAVAVQIHADGDALGLLFGSAEPAPASIAAATVAAAASATAAHTIAAATARPGWLPRLAAYPGQARARITGTQSHTFRWDYDDPRGETVIPAACALHALIEVPSDMVELAGSLLVDVTLVRAGWRNRSQPACLRKAIGFREPLPGAATATPATLAAAVRLCVAADVEAYSDRPNPLAELTQRRLVEALARARRGAGIDERAVHLQPQGDELFAILPVGIDESLVIPGFVNGLACALREINAAGDTARLRLRVAMHRGLMKEGPSGWVGNAPIAVHRILNAPALREALAANPEVDFVLGVPDVLYQDVLAHSVETPRAEDFREVTVELPEKRFREHAWVYLPRVERDEPG